MILDGDSCTFPRGARSNVGILLIQTFIQRQARRAGEAVQCLLISGTISTVVRKHASWVKLSSGEYPARAWQWRCLYRRHVPGHVARVLCLFSHITHVITLIQPGPRFVGLPIVGVFAHNNDWPAHALHSNNGSLATSQMLIYPPFYISISECFINVLIIWRQRKVITKLWSGPGGASLIATPTVITCYLLLSKWNFHVCSLSLLSSVVTLAKFSIIHVIIIATQSWCWMLE